ncbi:MAG TPA: pilus assembly protein TadG-related protein, partial [Hyphomicrobiaceae bacterium]|nr:pilus assembly protein TadG-related protein [Hyphomicrobiaceae bacterium]
MFAAVKIKAGQFKRDERGAIAIIFALTLTIVVMVAGLALDVGRAVSASTKLGAAIDAAALAAAKAVRLQGLSTAQAQAMAVKLFNQNFLQGGNSAAKINSIQVNVDTPNSSVEVIVDAEIPTTLARIAGITSLPLPRSSVATYDVKDIEVGLQLDVTGSMGGSKIVDLKSATKSLIDILIPDPGTATQQKIRVALAPYAA